MLSRLMQGLTRKRNLAVSPSITIEEAVVESEEDVSAVSGPSTRSKSNAPARSAEAMLSTTNGKRTT
eukprot:13758095-Ditylum_brightwellii.AAC.1